MLTQFSNNSGRVLLFAATMTALCLIATYPAHAQTLTVFHTFTGGADGGNPFDTPLLYNGSVFVTTHAGGAHSAGTVFDVNLKTHKNTVLHSFAGGPSDGAGPIAGLIQDAAGNLYGATYKGGQYNFGAIFELTQLGALTLLHSFQGPPIEGLGPSGTPIFDPSGNLFGTTYQGGGSRGYGTVYEISAEGVYLTGQSFPSAGGLVRAGLHLEEGVLYGTTVGSAAVSYGGTIFAVGRQTALYTFSGGADGAQPEGGVIGDGQGNLYGTASGGGSGTFGNGCGVIFEYNIASGHLTVLHTFTGPDGAVPMAGLFRDAQGNLYGTTLLGGLGYGTVFKLGTTGTLTTIHSFTGGADGASPNAGVIVDAAGNIWGTTTNGGSATGSGGYGTLFVITPPPAG